MVIRDLTNRRITVQNFINGYNTKQLYSNNLQDIIELIALLPVGTEVGIDYMGCLIFRVGSDTEAILWQPEEVGIVECLFEQAGMILVEEYYDMECKGSLGLSKAYREQHPIIVYNYDLFSYSGNERQYAWFPYSLVNGKEIKLPSMVCIEDTDIVWDLDATDNELQSVCVREW
jgi:hypothetical protein